MASSDSNNGVTHLGDPGFDPRTAGKKAAGLHELRATGARVPPGFVIGSEDDLAKISDATLAKAVAKLGGFPVAVRSSGTLEDLEGASFAGQYETFLGVEGVAALREKIGACRASAHTDRVRAYLKKVGLREDDARVSVLVQRMVPARIAGVAFTLHPLTGREEHALVECCEGLGEKLVSGHVTPTSYVLLLETGEVVETKPGSENAALSPAEARELAATLLDVQAHFGAPQDVEFAFDGGGKLHLLQSRPITKVHYRADIEEFTNADFKDGGISARVCTPLMFSLYRNAVQRSMQAYFQSIKLLARGAPEERWIAMYYGRGYWNASAVKRRLGKVPGWSEEKFDQDLGIQKSYGASGARVVPTNARTVVAAIPVALALEKTYRADLEGVKDFTRNFPSEYATWRARVFAFESTGDADFFRQLDEAFFGLHQRTECAYFTIIYNNSNAQSDFKSFLEKLDRATGRRTSVVSLMSGLADVHHMDVQRGYLRLYGVAKRHGFESAEWQEALATFLESNGFHADAELDLSVPRWDEKPEVVAATVRMMIGSGAEPADPDLTVAKQRGQFEDEVRGVEAAMATSVVTRLRFASGFRSHLERVRAYLSAREQMRECSTKAYAIVRRYVLEAGKRLAHAKVLPNADAIFMLAIEEVRDLAGGALARDEALRRIAFRKKMYDGYRLFTPPNELGQGVEQRTEASHVTSKDGRDVLTGLGCSPGIVEGVARVVTGLEEAHLLQKGDILITKFTDPGWTPVLGLVAGIVTEVGGMLSHAAVIGREYGIPAVLNLPGATKALKSGQRVRVNGATGEVEVLA